MVEKSVLAMKNYFLGITNFIQGINNLINVYIYFAY